MSDFLKRAAGLIFNVDDSDDTSDETTPAKKKPTENIISTGAAASYTAPIAPASSGSTDNASIEKFRAYFKNLYDKANMPGADFYEYHNMVEAMGNLIADEVKYPSVYAGFGGQITKEKLVSSAQHYLELLQSDRSDFDKSYAVAKQQKVLERKAQADKKAAEIKALQEKIAALNQDIIQLNQQASEDDLRLNSEQAAYYQQSDAFQQNIRTGIDKINQYLK